VGFCRGRGKGQRTRRGVDGKLRRGSSPRSARESRIAGKARDERVHSCLVSGKHAARDVNGTVLTRARDREGGRAGIQREQEERDEGRETNLLLASLCFY
jgi:hypothetical protein